MRKKQNQFDVIVVGAGLIGAAFALKLAHNSDLRVLVVEQSKRLTENKIPNQRVLALGNAATNLLQEIDVFTKLNLSNCYPYSRMFVWDEMSAGQLEFNAQDYQQDNLGYMVDAANLTLLLQQTMEEHSHITVAYEKEIKTLSLEPDLATLDEFSAQLIVGADGAKSWLRQQAKIFANRHDYQQQGVVARIQTELSHQETAWQVFLSSGPIGLLPLADNQCSIVWSAENALADDLLAMTEEEFEQALSEALQERLGAVELLSHRQAFPLTSMKAETYFKHRLALIGDAAHSIHPLAGQGANLGLKDVSALAGQLVSVEPNSIGDLAVLERYQRTRKADNDQTDMLMSALQKAYQTDLGWWPTIRGVGMNWIGGSEQLKSLFVKQAMGQI